jgi:hypothetical protein
MRSEIRLNLNFLGDENYSRFWRQCRTKSHGLCGLILVVVMVVLMTCSSRQRCLDHILVETPDFACSGRTLACSNFSKAVVHRHLQVVLHQERAPTPSSGCGVSLSSHIRTYTARLHFFQKWSTDGRAGQ